MTAPAVACIPFRVRIGVTGHRRLPDPTTVRRKLREVLDKKIGEMFAPEDGTKGSAPVVFSISSSLAEGADRLVAEEILRLPGSELEAVLPLTADNYEQDFASFESKAEFRSLLRRARRTIVMKAVGDVRVAVNRDEAYEAAGRYVADHCDLLIAVWDGRPSRGRGGTAEIVAYARRKGVPLAIVPTEKRGGIRCERGGRGRKLK